MQNAKNIWWTPSLTSHCRHEPAYALADELTTRQGRLVLTSTILVSERRDGMSSTPCIWYRHLIYALVTADSPYENPHVHHDLRSFPPFDSPIIEPYYRAVASATGSADPPSRRISAPTQFRKSPCQVLARSFAVCRRLPPSPFPHGQTPDFPRLRKAQTARVADHEPILRPNFLP
ncbi:hypothetical protein VUR80DRAFT_4482 [Thermomyces stellatus]